MANDRFYIVCDGCKEYRWLSDWHPGCPLDISKDGSEWLNDFFSQHSDCMPINKGVEFGESVGFSFGNETTVLKEGYVEHKYAKDSAEIECFGCGVIIEIPVCDKPDDSKEKYCMECLKIKEKENE